MCPGSGGWSYPSPGSSCEGLPSCQLYDLEEDISETTNLIERHPEVADELRDRLTDIIRSGRSTPGSRQQNDGKFPWEQLWWLNQDED